MPDEYVVLPGGCRIIINDLSTSDIHGAGLDEEGRITRIDGITGYAEECTRVVIGLAGIEADPVEADVDPLTRNWAAPPLILDEAVDLCNQRVDLVAHCADDPDCQTTKTIWQLPCTLCPSVTGTADPDGSCTDDGLREVGFTLHFHPPVPTGSGVEITWFFAPGFLNESVTIPDGGLAHHTRTRNFPAGTYFPGAVVQIDFDDLVCQAEVEFPPVVVQSGCGTPQACPELILADPVVSGCAAPGTHATFQATVTPAPAPVPPTVYTWTVTEPGGPTHRRETVTTAAGTADLWQHLGQGSEGPVDLTVPGAYAVRVTADVPDSLSGCAPEDTRAFTVPACVDCPTVTIEPPEISGCIPDDPAVSFVAQVAPPPSQPVTYQWQVGFEGTGSAQRTTSSPTVDSTGAWAHDDGNTGPLASRLATVNMVSVTALITGLPEDCPPPTSTRQFVIPQCGGGTGTNGSEDEGFNWEILWCVLAFIGVVLLLASAAVAIIVAGCLWLEPISVGIAIALAIAALIALVLWVLFCGPGLCPLLRWFIYILNAIILIVFVIGIILVIVGIIFSETIALAELIPCGIGFVLSSGYLGIASIIATTLAEWIGCSVWRNRPRR